MTRTLVLAAVAGLLFAAPARAEVVERDADGFLLRMTAAAPVDAARAYASVSQIARWWDPAHTYSGDAANLTMDLSPGGCFCERLPGGGVRHGEVVLAWPERMVRLDAPLGPLQETGASAVWTLSWSPAEGGRQALDWTYRVRGPGVGAYADAVDGVMRGQFERWVAALSD